MKLWHDGKHNRVYVFYRTGDCVKLPLRLSGTDEYKISPDKTLDLWKNVRQRLSIWEQLLDSAIEQIFIYKNKVLIVKTCKAVMFFIQEVDDEDKEIKWKRYHKLKVQGDIYLLEGS